MGGGKSRTLCEEMVRQMVKFPGNRGLLVRATLADFMLSTYITLTEEVLQQYVEAGLVKENKKIRYFDFNLPQGRSRLYYGGLDMSKEDKEKYFSTQYGCIGIDEAREVKEDEFKKLGTRFRHKLPDGTRPDYYLLLASNPSQNWLKRYFVTGPAPNYLFVPALPKENKYNPPDYEEQIRDLFHGDEAFIRAYLEGSWDAIASIDDLILPADLDACKDLKIHDVNDRHLTSIDLARMGDDMTSIYNFHNCMVESQEFYGKKDAEVSIGRVIYNREKNKSRMVVTGYNGMDQVFYDWLRSINGEMSQPYDILEVDFNEKAVEPRFYNMRAQVYWYLREQIKNRACSIPKSDVQLASQICSIKYKFKGGKQGLKIIIESKKDLKKRLGFSPDKADSYAIGIYGHQTCPVDKDKPTWKDTYKPTKLQGSAMAA